MKQLRGIYVRKKGWALKWFAVPVSLILVTQAIAVNYPSTTGSLSGTLLTRDKINGNFVVEAEESGGWSQKVTTGVRDYYLSNLTAYKTYTLLAFRDSNANGTKDPWEEYNLRQVYVSGNLSGINSFMTSPDLDGDGVPDWWEYEYFGDFGEDAGGDFDGDGLSNLEEYQHDTNPISADSDGDGMADGWEILHSFDPLSSADGGAANADGDELTNVEEFERGTDPHDSNSTRTGVLVVMPDADQYRANEPDLSWTDLP